MLLIGHRGACGTAPENTLASFAEALAAGVDGIELDVQRSRDGVPIVFHDATLDRTTDGQGPVGAFDLAALRRLDAGGWFAPRFAGERIPTLAEALDFLGGRCRLMIELKDPAKYPGIERQVRDLVHAHRAAAWVEVHSFSEEALRRFHALDPRIPLKRISRSPETLRAPTIAGGHSLHHRAARAAQSALERALRAGTPVYIWTVNDAASMRAFATLGVQGLITNYPARAQQELRVRKDE